jgi:hypothetical protein
MASLMNLRRSWLAFLAVVAVGCIPAHAADDHVLHHWSFDAPDDAGAYADAPGGRTATPADKSQIAVVDGKYNSKAVSFNGQSTSFLTIPPITDIQKRPFTVAAWVYFRTPGPNFILTDWQSYQQAGFVFGVNPMAGAKDTAQPIADLASGEPPAPARRGARGTGNRPSVIRQAIANKPVPMNDWHHMAWTWDPTATPPTLTCYLDGESIGEAKKTSPTPRSLDLPLNNHPMRIGSQEAPLGGQPAYNGYLDELWIFDQSLTPIQLGNLIKYNSIHGAPPAPVASNPPASATTPSSVPATPITPALPATPTPVAAAPSPSEATTAAAAESRDTHPVTTPPAAVTTRFTPLRTTGIIAGLIVVATMAGYLLWAFTERASLKAAGRL